MQEILNKIFENGEKINKLSFFTKALGALRGLKQQQGAQENMNFEVLWIQSF